MGRGGTQAQCRKKEDKHIGIFKLFLHTRDNTMLKFSCTRNTICVHVMYTMATIHAYESL